MLTKFRIILQLFVEYNITEYLDIINQFKYIKAI